MAYNMRRFGNILSGISTKLDVLIKIWSNGKTVDKWPTNKSTAELSNIERTSWKTGDTSDKESENQSMKSSKTERKGYKRDFNRSKSLNQVNSSNKGRSYQ